MVVDPGILESQQVLINALEKEGLTVDDINTVCITHSHMDHYRNLGMFPNAKVLDYFGVWEKNTVENWQEHFSSSIQILRTPGHDNTDITLFVTTGPDSEYPGVVAICGDVFWREDYPKNPGDDKYALDSTELGHSREIILRMSDWIIPGHGGIYKTRKVFQQGNEKSNGGARKKDSKDIIKCKKCQRVMEKKGKCLCRPWLCFRCCECGLDCDLCYCSHRKK